MFFSTLVGSWADLTIVAPSTDAYVLQLRDVLRHYLTPKNKIAIVHEDSSKKYTSGAGFMKKICLSINVVNQLW